MEDKRGSVQGRIDSIKALAEDYLNTNDKNMAGSKQAKRGTLCSCRSGCSCEPAR